MPRCLVLSFLLAGIVPLLLSPARAADVVRLQNGEDVKGEIRKETVQEISLQVGGRNQNVPRRDVAPGGITYENMPQQLREAQDALAVRDFARAHTGFRNVIQLCEAVGAPAESQKQNGKAPPKKPKAPAPRAAATGATRPIFLQHALYGEVQTYAQQGKADDAVTAIDELLNRAPDSWYLVDALLLKVRLLAAKGDPSVVSGAIKDAEKRAASAGIGAEVADRAKLIQADLLVKKGKGDEAFKIYQDLDRSPIKAVSDNAKLGKAQLKLATSPRDANIEFKGLLREAKERAILCGAARGVGEALLSEMKGQVNVDTLREALESYLRAAVLYFPAEGDPTDEHRSALLKAAECAEQLVKELRKADPKSQEGKSQEGYRAIARDLYQELRAVYPQTEEARAAATGLQRLTSGAAQ